MSMEHVDALVIGAGPSGTAAAAWLADKGHKVVIIERAIFPRFVIGESLLPLSMGHWEETGLLPALQAQNFAVKEGARFYRDGKLFNLAFGQNYTQGWTWTWQVPRADFDDVLAKAVMAKGVPIHFGHEAISVDLEHEKGVHLISRGKDGTKEFTAPFVIDSSGYGGVLVKLLDLGDTRENNGRMALFTHVVEGDTKRATVADPMQISFEVLARDLWFWSIPFSNGNTSIGFVGHRDHFQEALKSPTKSETIRKMLEGSHIFGERFKDGKFDFEPKVIDEYTHYNLSLTGPGYVLTGNCAGFLDPVFSSGVGFATESGLLAAKLLDRQLKGETIDWQVEYEAHIKKGAAVFRSYVDDWYSGDLQDVFFANKVEQSHKERIISVLAGYVWDKSNPYVTKHDRLIKALAHSIRMEEGQDAELIRPTK
ncbi:MAG TPA: NAD(P)/FAD-dependent oxidoreductase [Flavobacteriales bacterium]|jgi:flavin-dependent dehydrogenase|nr:tryptophan 7-halogenase [Flavobacteriales bacterium]MBP6642936.1 tryptophan 7-halogenase [Flavobacteriales bacterium]HQV75176.1 NAD(P)/FAD-dependent oxidoreductase [Flavobacteriales bacterium]HQW40641.1 NAD(P)/FAD-dependent oxidoreductase [Flavobacteriales bacterium]